MKTLAFVFVLFAQVVYAQVIEGEIELAGFILGQYRTAVHAQLGQPIEKRKTSEGWIYEFHKLKPDTSVYALFKYPAWDTTRIYSIQVNGDAFAEMHPIRGLRLGSKSDAVAKAFGNPDRTDKVDDPPLTVQYYDHKNYSVDIDNRGALCGVQIFGNILENKPREATPTINAFRNAVVSRNTDSLLTYLAPDVEFYKGGKVISFTGAARKEFEKSDSQLIKHLLGETGSLWYVFTKELAQGAPEVIHNSEESPSAAAYKFYDSNVISEIVFYPHAGRWKVYEVKFR